MRRVALATVALAAAIAPLGTSPAAAQDALARGLEALRSGEYGDAVRALDRAASEGSVPARVAALRALSRAHLATGEYDDALEVVDAAAVDGVDPSVAAVELGRARASALVAVGRGDEALAALERAIAAGSSDAIPARLDRALLLWNRGRRDEAYRDLDGFIDLYNDGRARSSAELTAVGTAVAMLGRRNPDLYHDAVRAYEEALAADPRSLEPKLRMAELFLDRYDGGEAQTLLAEVLAVNPRHVDALLAMARAKRFEGSGEALALVERALEVNPRSPDGRALLAMIRLEAADDDAAIAEAGRALEVDPAHREALAVRAAARALADDDAGYEADRRRAMALDPAYAGFHMTIAELAVRRGRYAEAVEQAERAVALDSTAWQAWTLLGMNQLRRGDVAAARASLERAYAGDPFNAWSRNTLELMDDLATFTTRRSERFELVLHPDEADLLEPYVAEVAEEAFTRLAARYRHEPAVPVRVEVYPDHRDFSVRTMGLKGLAALGVAFGNVLALNSPAARDAGSFHWGSTLWHEIAHAVTLGRTRHRIPRWLTEGISVHEERRSRPGWGGGATPDFLLALSDDRLLPLDRIDEGFVRPTWPGQVGVSYQHASFVVEKIERDHGDRAVLALMDAYEDGKETAAAFRDALGVDVEAFDRALLDWLRQRHAAGVAAIRSLARGDEGQGAGSAGGTAGGADVLGLPGSGDDPASLIRTARLRRDDFGAQLAAGTALARADRAEAAIEFLERAKALYPEYAGPGSPYELLAGIRRERGDIAGAAEELRRLTILSETAYDANLALADLLEQLDDAAGAADALERAIYIWPYEPAVHERLADLAATLARPRVEVRERRALLALSPVDRAGALYRLALAHRRAGESGAARRRVLEALEIAPSYADAQELLLEMSGGEF